MLTNVGLAAAYDAQATLRSDDAFISIIDSTAFYGNIEPHDSVECISPYVIAIAPTCPDSHEVDFEIFISDSADNNWLDGFSIRVYNTAVGPGTGPDEYGYYMYDDTDPNALSGGKLYIGLVTGFPAAGIDSDNLYAGDMFIDFGNTGGYDLAVAVSTSTVNADDPSGVDNDYYGNNYFNDGTANWEVRDPSPFIASTPWRVVRNAAIHGRGDNPQRELNLTMIIECCEQLSIIIQDDGVGSDKEIVGQHGGLILHSTMLAIVGGTLETKSIINKGTTVKIRVPTISTELVDNQTELR